MHISEGDEACLNPACADCNEPTIRPSRDEIYLHAYYLEIPHRGVFKTEWPEWAKLEQ